MKKAEILVVEDESIVSLEIEDALKRLGYDVCGVVGSGNAAIAEAGEKMPDLILMDVNLKGEMDGIETAGRIRKQYDIPVVYLTAYTDQETIRRAKLTQPLGYLQKPFKEEGLRITLEMAIYTAGIEAERKQTQERLAREVKTIAALEEISRLLLSSSKNIHSFSEVILEQSRSLTGSRNGYTFIIDSRTGESELFALPPLSSTPNDNDPAEDTSVNPKELARESQKFLKSSQSAVINEPFGWVSIDGTAAGRVQIDNYLTVPIYLDSQISGQIILANSPEGYSDYDLKTVEQIGELFAMAIQGHRIEIEKEEMYEQMRQMQKMEAIGTLAGGIAHDFNNILQPIMGYANMALKGIDEKDNRHRYISSILIASQRARELVQQILTFARRNEQELQPVEVKLIVKETIKLLRSSLPATIEIKQKIDRHCGLVMADPTKIHQVVMNLTTNAYHAMQETGGVMRVSLAPKHLKTEELPDDDAVPGQFLCLTISDDGVGMERKVLDKIFDPYFTTKGQTKGTGLGLSVVMGIVKSIGGFIMVESEPGKGTEFRIYMPQIQNEAVDSETPAEPAVFNGSEHVLLVDDESAIVELEESMLEQLGYQVTARNSGVEALELFKQQADTFDMVVTDMTMPNMTGAEMARQMLTIRPELPIIICTGFSELINEEKAEAIGVKKLLLKPVSQNQLGAAIREVLDA